MDIFYATLSQMLVMFIFILAGFLLRKSRILPEDAHTVLAKLETYILVPALTFSNWTKNCTVETLVGNANLILYGLALMIVALLLSEPLSRLFVRDVSKGEVPAYQRQIYKYAMTFGNYGFMGNFIVLSIWGSERFFQYSMFTLVVGFICSSWGLLILIPRHKGQKETIKSMIKRILPPPMIALIIGCIVGILNLKQYIPEFFLNACANAGDCMGPIAMLIAGIVIGGYDFKELLGNKKVYVATFLRLIVIPGVFVTLLKLVGADTVVQTLALIAFGTPLGLNTVVYPAAYGGDTKTGASMAMISHVLSVITIPVMYLILIVL